MGRFSASGARLHEPRQPKPANAAFRQGQPPRSRDFSLGLEHPQRAIPPACREEPAFGRYRTASRAPSAAGAGAASASPNSPRRPRGALPASSPWNPTGRMPAQSAAGAVARDAPLRAARATSPQNSGRHRLVSGNSAGMPALAGLRESGAPHRLPDISADKPSKEALHRRPIGKPRQKPTASQGSAEAFARTEDSRRQIAASMPHASGPIDCRPRPHLSKRPRKRPWDGQLRQRKCTKRNAAPKAPQERRRGCTRTPRRRRRSGWTQP